MTPEWSDFKILLALSRAGSVVGAARELQVDNSTVSRRLAALEEAVGAKLIIRGGREFSWTAEGRTLLDAAEAMEASTAAALRVVRASKVEVEGCVRISVAPAFVQVLMRMMIPALRRAHPSLNNFNELAQHDLVLYAEQSSDDSSRIRTVADALLAFFRSNESMFFG